ncbi:nitrite reductase small subunit NirD [Paenibacillus sp. FSL R7-0048]|jgi:nitrite reductase (NADH) small subunit|uniref:nitrite reductase small subunit NirD n=1 Tax=Paenibacillus TaxID=44249 RepID=UPI00096DCA83|nr:nitrite reductase small subunit NirD [Paenibacillus odorifer]OMC73204.1 nitrite reductase [Paenibacillus odorifer]OMC76629.1 nitrite reductase [Paenibacillus odorifer]OMD69984.1 nitrite reductase [Paenibacillus odorifer]OMD81092.1 nitrite reductase [Paenibacillus odorifer]OMD93720.1 nitrite reductase [Paenibacillus odorifer]
MNKTTQTYAIGSVQDFLLQIGRVVIAGNIELAVFRASDGAIYAVENRSPHPKGGPLAEGIVSGHYLYDPLYDWKIDLRTGEVQAPDQGSVVTYPVTLDGEKVTVSV